MTENQQRAVRFIQATLDIRYAGDGSVASAQAFIGKHLANANKRRQGLSQDPGSDNQVTDRQRKAIWFIEHNTNEHYDKNDKTSARLFIMKHMKAAQEAAAAAP